METFSLKDIKLSMFCSKCKNEKLFVCVSHTGALVILCNDCKSVTAFFDKWPEETPPECHNCNKESCNEHSKKLN